MKMIEAARSVLGAPFCEKGRSLLGFDCLGLLLYAARYEGKLKDLRAPSNMWPSQKTIESLLKKHANPIGLHDIKPGDIAVFYEKRTPRHLGILTGEGTFIHASQILGSVVEEALSDKWQRHIYGLFRLK